MPAGSIAFDVALAFLFVSIAASDVATFAVRRTLLLLLLFR